MQNSFLIRFALWPIVLLAKSHVIQLGQSNDCVKL